MSTTETTLACDSLQKTSSQAALQKSNVEIYKESKNRFHLSSFCCSHMSSILLSISMILVYEHS